MSEKRTLSQSVSRSVSQWLRRQDVYEAAESEPVAKHWRESLLADFEHPAVAPLPVREPVGRTPLQWHHLALMAPAGAALFGLGWLMGNGSLAVAQMARISPLVWMAVAVLGSAGVLAWRGLAFMGRR